MMNDALHRGLLQSRMMAFGQIKKIMQYFKSLEEKKAPI